MIERYNLLKQKAQKHLSLLNAKKINLAEILEDLKENTSRFNALVSEQNELLECQRAIKVLLDSLSTKHITHISNLVTTALKTIFHDRDYSLEVVVDDKRSVKTLDLFLVEKVFNPATPSEPDIIRASFQDGIGGGILSVVGFILQVYYLLHYNLSPIIFCDESFSQLSSHYIENFLAFITELANQKQFKIVLVSHDPRLIEKAIRVYNIEEGSAKLIK